MKGALFALLAFSLILLPGCMNGADIGCMMMDDIFGWPPGYHSECSGSGSTSSSANQATGMATQEQDDEDEGGILNGIKNALDRFDEDSEDSGVLSGNLIQNHVDMDEFCSNFPHTHPEGSSCVCDDGYEHYYGQCVKSSESIENRECTFDQDCSPSGSDKATCSADGRYSYRYRCDLRTYTCTPRKGTYAERVDCQAEFGKDSVCRAGLCT